MDFDPERVRMNVRKATTEDLLDRVTVYREGMEPEAVEIIEGELQDRGVYRDQIRAHAERRAQQVLPLPDGTAAQCSFCHRPAVAEGWGWHWLGLMIWGKKRSVFPVFPRYYYYCDAHQPAPKAPVDAS
jgi:hypothetical protein